MKTDYGYMGMKKKNLFIGIIIIILLGNQAFSENIQWYQASTKSILKVNFSTSKLERLSVSGQLMDAKPILGNYEELQGHSHDLNNIFHFNLNGVDYFSNKATGHVYVLKGSPLSLIKVGLMEGNQSQHLAYHFVYEGSLHSIGGIRSNANSPQFQRFNMEQGVWEEIPLSSEGPNLLTQDFCGFDQQQKVLWVLDQYGKKNGEKIEYTLFKLSLQNKQWSNLGRLNVFEIEKLVSNIKPILWNGRRFIFSDGNNLLLADPNKNILYVGKEALEKKLLNHSISIMDESEGLVRFKSSSDDVALLTDSGLDPLVQVLDNRFYLNENIFEKIEAKDFFLAFFFGGFMMLWYKNGQIKKEPSRIKSKSTMMQLLSDKQKQFLMVFQQQGVDFEMGTNELNELIGCDKKNLDNQKLIRTKFINHFNQLFAEHYQIDPLIIRKAAESDRRFVHYSLNPEASEILKEIWKNLNS